MERPAPDEYAPYEEAYVDSVPDGDVLRAMEEGLEETLALLRRVPEERATHRYAPGKWSVKEVVGHLVDCERIHACRALRIARGDATPLPGFDENAYVREAGFDRRMLADLLAEFEAVRRASLAMFRSLRPEETTRRGTANGKVFSVRALAAVLAGHERHHAGVLRERYGLAAEGGPEEASERAARGEGVAGSSVAGGYRHGGARTLVALHEESLRAFLATWKRARATGSTLPPSPDPDCASLEAMLSHVQRAARGYLVWICEKLGLPDPGLHPAPPAEDAEAEADAYLEHLSERWRLPLRDIEEERFYRPDHESRWGARYCIDAMLEHAVMHPIRHRHQLGRWLQQG